MESRQGHTLYAFDVSERAVQLARRRLEDTPQVFLACASVPEAWPRATFDLIVLSEMAYYLRIEDLERLIVAACASLAADGTLLACHWRHPIPEGELRGDDVHRLIGQLARLPHIVQHEDQDFLLDVWSSTRSAALAGSHA